MGQFIKVARVQDISPNSSKVVEVADKKLALFNVNGEFYALDNACRHRGGPLGEGELTGTVVTCPWHGWQYDVTSGAVVDDPSQKVACYHVRVEGDDVLIEL